MPVLKQFPPLLFLHVKLIAASATNDYVMFFSESNLEDQSSADDTAKDVFEYRACSQHTVVVITRKVHLPSTEGYHSCNGVVKYTDAS